MTDIIEFWVDGQPVPKQSFRYTSNGGGYISPRVAEWEMSVKLAAMEVAQMCDKYAGAVKVRLDFYLENKRRVDLDNLSKGVLDGMKGILFGDDCNVTDLHLTKAIDKDHPGVMVRIEAA